MKARISVPPRCWSSPTLDALPVAAYVAAASDLRLLVSNRRCCEILDAAGTPIDGDSSVAGSFPDGLRSSLLEAHRRVNDTGEHVALASQAAESGATTSYFDVDVVPLRDADGDASFHLATIWDVTGRVVAEHRASEMRESLRATNERLVASALAAQASAEREASARAEAQIRAAELEQADARKNEFLAMLGHELRNPLAGIATALHLLGRRGLAPEQVNSFEVLERQTRNLTRIVDDLLDVSRITNGRIALRREPIVLAAVLESAIAAVRRLVDERRHELSVALPPEPIALHGDPVRLEQVFSNLLVNAAKYMDPGGRIRVTAEREGTDAVVRIVDEGIGIGPEIMPRIFEPFVQADRSLARSEGGLGIGLTLVQKIAELHGGGIEAHSEGDGRGSEFVLRLPVDECRGTHPVRAASNAARSLERDALRVLVVDDNVDFADGLSEALRLLGHEPVVAYDGCSAVDAVVRDGAPDLVLLDIGLPRVDGYEVARRLRAAVPAGSRMRIVAVTGYGQRSDRERAEEAGFDGHFVKPLELRQLERLLER